MLKISLLIGAGFLFACGVLQQTPQPVQLEQLKFEIQTATPTVSMLFDAPTATPHVKITRTAIVTFTLTPTVTLQPEATTSPN